MNINSQFVVATHIIAILAGSRLAFNDIQSTQLLAGFVFDYKDSGFYPSIEASRRFGESFIVNL